MHSRFKKLLCGSHFSGKRMDKHSIRIFTRGRTLYTVYTATCGGTPMRDTGARIRSGTFLSEVRIFSFFVPNCKIFDKTFIARNGDIYKESFEVIKANICSAVFSNTSTPVEQSCKKSNYSKQNAISNSLDTL